MVVCSRKLCLPGVALVSMFLVFGTSEAADPVALQPPIVEGRFVVPSAQQVRLLPELLAEEESSHYLRRAIRFFGRADYESAISALQHCGPNETGSDQAAFLLGMSYLRLGNRSAFLALVNESLPQAAGSNDASPFLSCLRRQAILISHHANPGQAELAKDVIAAAEGDGLVYAASLLSLRGDWESAEELLLRAPKSILSEYLRALTVEARGEDGEIHFQEVVRQQAESDLDIQISSLARIRLAERASVRGSDPGIWLSDLDPASKWHSYGSHLRALYSLEAGDSLSARALFEDVLRSDPRYERRDEVERYLGSIALAQEDNEGAYNWFRSAQSSWTTRWDELESIGSSESLDQVAEDWGRQGSVSEVLVLDAGTFQRDLFTQLAAATTLGSTAKLTLPELGLGEAMGSGSFVSSLPHPAVSELRRLSAASVAAEEAYYALERNQWELEQLRIEESRRRGYLGRGREELERVLLSLRGVSNHLRDLELRIPGALEDLDQVESDFLEMIAERATRIQIEGERIRLRIAALDHFYTGDPHASRNPSPPEGYPSAEKLLDREEALSAALSETSGKFAVTVPEVIRRSSVEIWRPRLTSGVGDLRSGIDALLARADRLLVELNDTIEELDRGDRLAALAREGQELRFQVAEKVRVHQQLGRTIVTVVLKQERAKLQAQREGLDYSLAYAHFVSGRESEAIDLYDAFLANYPESSGQSEVHYRLADLHLERAKTIFRSSMETFLEKERQGEPIGVVPILDLSVALGHYEAILAPDLPFAHLDAVLYHVGVIRADDGDSSGIEVLARLVDGFPDSPFVQEARLRQADFYFDDGQLAKAADLYVFAADGADPSLAAVSLYKLGWTHFNRNQFRDAASAFANVLRLYHSGVEVAVEIDLEVEANDYLTHALARMGGGASLVEFFDSVGEEPYTADVILGVSSLLRRFALLGEAIETDRAWIQRYPKSPDVLLVADQVVDGLEAWNKPEEARRARLEFADYFLAGSEWHGANSSDSLGAEAHSFSTQAYKSVALFHHYEARDLKNTGREEHWRESLRLYSRMVELWPESVDRSRVEFYSGEAARELGEYERADFLFASAAESDSATFATEALWQQIVTLQTWYQTTPSDRESLVAKTLSVGDQFLQRYPYDLRGRDLVWSQGHLAFSHRQDGRAAEDFGRFVERYPADTRVLPAATLRGDAFYRSLRYDAAGEAYELAARVAEAAGQDSVAHELQLLVPHSFYLHAESIGAESVGIESAEAFARIARRWSEFEFADHALYRSADGFLAAKDFVRAGAAYEELLHRYPQSPLARDSYLQVAGVYEDNQRVPEAARVLEAFSETYPEDEEADDALLRAADLWADLGDDSSSERIQLRYIDRFPEDKETLAFVLHRMAKRDLLRATESGNLQSEILKNNQSYLSRYLVLEADPDAECDPAIRAETEFLIGEEGRSSYLGFRLTLPLDESVGQKNSLLGEMLVAYRKSITTGVSPFSEASAYRIGECLVAFGESLVQSERPRDLSADDRIGYDEVLDEQAWGFYDRGEEVWTNMLKNLGPEANTEGTWIQKTKTSLWPRIAQRFLHYAEVDYPTVEPSFVPERD